MKTGRGWWALAGMIVGSAILLLALYVAAYCWLMEPRSYANYAVYGHIAEYPKTGWIDLEWCFRPIHWIDREWIRPEYWEYWQNRPPG
ncbi:MAG TPA: hypothetical protein VHB77_01610 [Planctomycetaceae bacterium]|nr:hypothetical protein [Planctomycetaceae bacterium]